MTSAIQPIVADWFCDALNDCVVQASHGLDVHLKEIQTSRIVKNTKTTLHCYFIRNNSGGLPRTKELIALMRNAIVNYCIPVSQRLDAARKVTEKIDPNADTELMWIARDLFTNIDETGEGGELLLYLLTESILRIPQIIKKMPLKTNKNMHFHGSDGVYAKYDEAIDKLALYWGESKLHKTIQTAVSSALKSLKPFLYGTSSEAGGPDRDLQLISANIDLSDERLEEELLKYLDMKNPRSHNCIWRGVCLVGFDSDEYPLVPHSKKEDEIFASLQQAIDGWEKYINRRLTAESMHTIDIELFCIPFPNVDDFRNAFLSALGIQCQSKH